MKSYIQFWTAIQVVLFFVLEGVCCSHQALFKREVGQYLANNAIRTEQTNSELDCSALCSRESSCVAVNYKTSGENRGMCELKNKDLQDAAEDGRLMPEFTNLRILQRVISLSRSK